MLGVVTLVFFLTHLIPGSAVSVLLGPLAGQAQIEDTIRKYGLDKPLVQQYTIYLSKLLHGDLGRSIVTGRSTLKDIAVFLPASVELVGTSLVIIVVVGLALGVTSAVHKDKFLDVFARGVAVAGVSIPQFWMGLMAILVCHFWINLFPIGGRISAAVSPPAHITGLYVLDSLITRDWSALADSLYHMVLPTATLAVSSLSTITRVTRSSMLDTLKKDYIITAKAYGFTNLKINYKYALKNALISSISVLGLLVGYLLGGTFLVEAVFDWPGIGLYAAQSIVNVDYSPVIAVALIISGVYVSVNLLVDILYWILDPRIKY